MRTQVITDHTAALELQQEVCQADIALKTQDNVFKSVDVCVVIISTTLHNAVSLKVLEMQLGFTAHMA